MDFPQVRIAGDGQVDTSRMRRIDRWLGLPACAALTLLRKFSELLNGTRPRPIRRIAFIKLAEQGATVLAHSAIQRAVNMVGANNVYFVVFEQNRFVLDVMDLIPEDNVIPIRTKAMISTIAEAFRAVRRLRHLRIDAVVDCEFFARSSAVLAYLSGATSRAGFHAYYGEASYRGDLMTHRLSFNPLLHASEMFRLLVEALAWPPEQLPACSWKPELENEEAPAFHPTEAEHDTMRSLICDVTGRSEPPTLMLLNANCSDMLPLRRWPAERYVELARRLLDTFPDITIGLTGAPSEEPSARQLAAAMGSPRCVSFAGRTTLRQLLVLYGFAELLITNDSGPAQFAALTPIDVITLFGPETPAVFGSRSPRSHILWAGVACSPCVNAYNDRQSACRNNLCMQAISVDDVLRTACAVYEARRNGGSHSTGDLPWAGRHSRVVDLSLAGT